MTCNIMSRHLNLNKAYLWMSWINNWTKNVIVNIICFIAYAGLKIGHFNYTFFNGN